MKYVNPTQEAGTQAIEICQDYQTISVFANNRGKITIQSKNLVVSQNLVTITVDPEHVDELIRALAQIKNEF
jgi:hypothetical protein